MQKLNALIIEAAFSPEIRKRLTEEFALLAHRLDLVQCTAQDRAERAKRGEPSGTSQVGRAKCGEYVKIAHIEPQLLHNSGFDPLHRITR